MDDILNQLEDLKRSLPDNPERIDEDALSEIRKAVEDIITSAEAFKKDLNKLI